MGTRADFYVGYGETAEWLGSVAFDGYYWAENKKSDLMKCKSEKEFRTQVENILWNRKDATIPSQGWPWPWSTSKGTDFVYFFDGKKVKYRNFGGVWPDMTEVQNVTFGKRSGIILL